MNPLVLSEVQDDHDSEAPLTARSETDFCYDSRGQRIKAPDIIDASGLGGVHVEEVKNRSAGFGRVSKASIWNGSDNLSTALERLWTVSENFSSKIKEQPSMVHQLSLALKPPRDPLGDRALVIATSRGATKVLKKAFSQWKALVVERSQKRKVLKRRLGELTHTRFVLAWRAWQFLAKHEAQQRRFESVNENELKPLVEQRKRLQQQLDAFNDGHASNLSMMYDKKTRLLDMKCSFTAWSTFVRLNGEAEALACKMAEFGAITKEQCKTAEVRGQLSPFVHTQLMGRTWFFQNRLQEVKKEQLNSPIPEKKTLGTNTFNLLMGEEGDVDRLPKKVTLWCWRAMLQERKKASMKVRSEQHLVQIENVLTPGLKWQNVLKVFNSWITTVSCAKREYETGPKGDRDYCFEQTSHLVNFLWSESLKRWQKYAVFAWSSYCRNQMKGLRLICKKHSIRTKSRSTQSWWVSASATIGLRRRERARANRHHGVLRVLPIYDQFFLCLMLLLWRQSTLTKFREEHVSKKAAPVLSAEQLGQLQEKVLMHWLRNGQLWILGCSMYVWKIMVRAEIEEMDVEGVTHASKVEEMEWKVELLRNKSEKLGKQKAKADAAMKERKERKKMAVLESVASNLFATIHLPEMMIKLIWNAWCAIRLQTKILIAEVTNASESGDASSD